MAPVSQRAFAKINLSLRIGGLRADGFHDVKTILQAIELYDVVRCEPRKGAFRIRCASKSVPTGRSNLVWKAAQLLWTTAGRAGEPRDALVTIEKNIPMQAGLGGGSSDAAAALIGLRRVWKMSVTDDAVSAAAAAVGSDVPYFLTGGTALALGRGEEVYPLAELPRLWVVLVIPAFGVATKDAYGWLDTKRGREPFSGQIGEKGSRPLFVPLFGTGWLATVPLTNDLEGPVIEHHPVIAQLKARFHDEGALFSAMSGSGSTVFGLFTKGAAAANAARRLTAAGANVRCVPFRRRTAR
jgi:4-diphosphocytidyl-2-C-methyl-D-erythritol kinase